MARPLISVITAVYNGELYIEETIRSILRQTVSDFEYIIVDDASTDGSVSKILGFNDPRIKLIRNPTNLRLVGTRNAGLAIASGSYIALIDHDDVAVENRFELQLNAMLADPNLILIGSLTDNIDENGAKLPSRLRHYDSPEQSKIRLLFRNHFVNSTLFFKRIEEAPINYRPEFPLSEDYDFIVRMAELGKVHVLPIVLVKYRIHSQNYSRKMNFEMVKLCREVKIRQLTQLGISPSVSELEIHSNFEHTTLPYSRETLIAIASWMQLISLANEKNQVYLHSAFKRVVNDELALVAEYASKQGAANWITYLQHPYLFAILRKPLVAVRIFLKLIVKKLY